MLQDEEKADSIGRLIHRVQGCAGRGHWSRSLLCWQKRTASLKPFKAALQKCVRIDIAVLCCGLVIAAALPAAAQQAVPWRRAPAVNLQATNEPLNVFLARILTMQGLSASISATVAIGRVNGRFQGSVETIFRELSEIFGLMSYYDGSTLHVYSLAEAETRWLQVEPADLPRVARLLSELRLEDKRFPLRQDAAEGAIYVAGPPKYVELVTGIVASVTQTPSRPRSRVEVRVFALRHARAVDTRVVIAGTETTVPGVARILAEVLGNSPAEAPAAARPLPQTVPGLRGKGQIATGRVSARTADNDASTATVSATAVVGQALAALSSPRAGDEGPGARAALGAALATRRGAGAEAGPDGAAGAAGLPTAGREAAVTAEPRTNAVIVRDTAERMPLYQQLIDQLDVEVPLVDIEASVIDISGGKSEQLGIDWRLHGGRLDGVASPNGLAGGADGTRNAANNLINSGPPLSAGAGLIGTLVLGSQRNYLLSRINALAKSGDAKVTSNPRVLTLDNHEAVLQSTREFYVRVAGRDQVDLFPVSSGLSLRVTPTRVEDARGTRFKLLVRIEDGNTGSGAQVDQIPVVSRNAISTQAVVGDGESLLIGGYVVEERRESLSGVPGLASLPLLGRLLSQRSSEVSRVERLFLITPRLVSPRTPAAALPVAPRTGSPEMAPGEAPEMTPAMPPEVAPPAKPPLPAPRWP